MFRDIERAEQQLHTSAKANLECQITAAVEVIKRSRPPLASQEPCISFNLNLDFDAILKAGALSELAEPRKAELRKKVQSAAERYICNYFWDRDVRQPALTIDRRTNAGRKMAARTRTRKLANTIVSDLRMVDDKIAKLHRMRWADPELIAAIESQYPTEGGQKQLWEGPPSDCFLAPMREDISSGLRGIGSAIKIGLERTTASDINGRVQTWPLLYLLRELGEIFEEAGGNMTAPYKDLDESRASNFINFSREATAQLGNVIKAPSEKALHNQCYEAIGSITEFRIFNFGGFKEKIPTGFREKMRYTKAINQLDDADDNCDYAD